MSAFSHTDWTVTCNGCGCTAQARTDVIDRADVKTAADVRRYLKRRGWAVSLPGPRVGGRPTRQDFCPDHGPDRKPQEG